MVSNADVTERELEEVEASSMTVRGTSSIAEEEDDLRLFFESLLLEEDLSLLLLFPSFDMMATELDAEWRECGRLWNGELRDGTDQMSVAAADVWCVWVRKASVDPICCVWNGMVPNFEGVFTVAMEEVLVLTDKTSNLTFWTSGCTLALSTAPPIERKFFLRKKG